MMSRLGTGRVVLSCCTAIRPLPAAVDILFDNCCNCRLSFFFFCCREYRYKNEERKTKKRIQLQQLLYAVLALLK